MYRFIMNLIVSVFPVVILVAYGQLVVKWRVVSLGGVVNTYGSIIDRMIGYLSDPYIVSAYLAALLGSFVWLFILARLPLAIAFSVYQGLTFMIVVLGSGFLLNEPLSAAKLIGISLILIGIVIGIRQ